MPLFTSFSVQSCRRRWRKHHLWNYFGCFVGCHAPCILGIFYGSPSILGCQKPLRRGEKAACPRGHDDVFDREYFEMTITCTVCVPPMIFVVDPPVLGSDKVPDLYSFKKNTLGFQTQDFQSCILSKGWMLKMHLVPSGICVGNLLQPLQELLGTTRRGGRLARWPGIFRFSRKVGSVVCWTHMFSNWLFVETPDNCKLPGCGRGCVLFCCDGCWWSWRWWSALVVLLLSARKISLLLVVLMFDS